MTIKMAPASLIMALAVGALLNLFDVSMGQSTSTLVVVVIVCCR